MPAKFGKRKRPVGRRPRRVQKRKFQKKKPMFKPRKPISMGTEVYKVSVPPQASVSLVALTASAANGPKNSLLFLPSMFSQHHTVKDSADHDHTIEGTWVKFVYGSKSKFRVSFNGIANHADNYGGLNLMCHHGVCKITMEKLNSGHGYATAADFESAVLTLLKKELFNSGVTSDFLSFSQQNRNIKITSSFRVRPNRNDMILDDHSLHTANHQNQLSFPPPKLITINHAVPKMKTKINKSAEVPPRS
jgi:hypothetical protein